MQSVCVSCLALLLTFLPFLGVSAVGSNFSSALCAPYEKSSGFCWSSLGGCLRYYDPSSDNGRNDSEIDILAESYYSYLVSQTQWTPYDCNNPPTNATPCVHGLPGYVETGNQQSCLEELKLIACYAYTVNCADDVDWGQPLCVAECPPLSYYMTSSWSFRATSPCLQYYGNLVEIWQPSYWGNLCDPTQIPNGTSWNNLAGQNSSCVNVCYSSSASSLSLFSSSSFLLSLFSLYCIVFYIT